MLGRFSVNALAKLSDWGQHFSRWVELLVISAFATTFILSFFRLLGSPLLYALLLGSVFLLLHRFWPRAAYAPTLRDAPPANKWAWLEWASVIYFFAFLALLMFFTPPISDDGQRAKLMRMLLGVYQGSAWDSSRVDGHSIVYYLPSVYYFVFSAIEALRLPTAFYSIFNASLMVASLFSLQRLLPQQPALRQLFPVVLFLFAPQFLFSALSEHEEALIWFLSVRAVFWLCQKDFGLKMLAAAVFAAVMAVAVKPTTAVFLPFALLVSVIYFAGMSHLRALFNKKYMLFGALFSVISVALLWAPDAMVSAARGLSLSDQYAKMSSYHVGTAAGCGLSHFMLRLFEFAYDPIKIFIGFFSLNISLIMPDSYDFMPKGCSHDFTTLGYFTTPNLLVRETIGFGGLIYLPLFGLLFARGRDRRFIALCLGLFLLSIAIYSVKLTYWNGIARYFIVGMLILLPAYLISLEALRARARWLYFPVVLGLLLPACFLTLKSDISVTRIPALLSEGSRYESRSATIRPALSQLHGPVNIYFNDLMPYFTLLKYMPMRDVWLKGEIMPDMTNLIAIPESYNALTNWHDDFYWLPVPDVKGDFTPLAPRFAESFGNPIRVTFFMTAAQHTPAEKRVRLVKYFPKTTPQRWIEQLGSAYHSEAKPGEPTSRYYITQRNMPHSENLCLMQSPGKISWKISTKRACGLGQ